MQIHPIVESLLEECVSVRRELHRIPEPGFEERKTQSYLMSYLMRLAPDSIEKIADTGVKAVFYAEHPTGTIAFRADMDAIRTTETTGAEYASCHPGKMHACGHDAHMAMVLMLAKLVSERREQLHVNVVLLFQPGEEGYGGAKRMVEEGALQNPAVDRIFGFHVWPTVPKGKIALRWGPMMAQTSEFDITVDGLSAHGASPQMGVDAIVTAAELISMLQTAITRNTDPHQDALLTIGKISGGSARNVIADHVVMNGTLRSFSNDVYAHLTERIVSMGQGLEMATGARIKYKELMHYPCVDNPRYLVEDFYRLVDMEDVLIAEQVMAGEDFSFYQQKAPGLFIFLGVEGGKNTVPLHNCNFDFDEDAMLLGIEIYRRILGIGA